MEAIDQIPKPLIQPIATSRVPHINRVTAAQAFWKEHCRILTNYLTSYPNLPAQLAEYDEHQVFREHSNQTDYRNAAAANLTRLKAQAHYAPDTLADPQSLLTPLPSSASSVQAAQHHQLSLSMALPTFNAQPPLTPAIIGQPAAPASQPASSPSGSVPSIANGAGKTSAAKAAPSKAAKRKASPGTPKSRQLSLESEAKRARGAAVSPVLDPIDYEEAYMFIFEDDAVIQWGYPTYDLCHAPIPPAERDSAGPGVVRTCDRCSRKFSVSETPGSDECTYHYGRLQIVTANGEKRKEYSCYQQRPGASGCASGVHVWKEERMNHLHLAVPFEVSPEVALDPKKRLPLVAIDCEMCYTTSGLELSRVTVLDMFGKRVIDELVKSKGKVLDLNTRYSGITSLEDAKFTLEQVRAELYSSIDQDTIIIGHGLENDLKAMRVIHPTIIDTAAVFPHPKSFPSRYPLRYLSSKLLQTFIQNHVEGGHDSIEDARACLELLRLKVKYPGLSL